MNLFDWINCFILQSFAIKTVILAGKYQFNHFSSDRRLGKRIIHVKDTKDHDQDNLQKSSNAARRLHLIAPFLQFSDRFFPFKDATCNFTGFKAGKFGILASLIVSSGCFLFNEDRLYNYRLTSALTTTAIICADYRLQEFTKSNIDDCHRRSAVKLGELCSKNGGMYIKAAQHLSSMDHLLPEVYIEELSRLQDQAPVSSLECVEQVFLEELGVGVGEVFSDFCDVPIGSASIGQVHLARLKSTGQQVAVKIQHPNIKKDSETDLQTFKCAFKIVKLLLPSTNFDWILEELRDCLDSEMNFVLEAENSKRAARAFSLDSKLKSLVLIPKIHDEFTSKRILTMEFISGYKINDLERLEAAKIDTNLVNKLMYQAFMEMIFNHGFVHCDPHPGNILINFDDGKVKLVLLDHGLYKTIPSEIVKKFSKLLIAILDGDEEEIGRCAKEMDISLEFLDEFMKLIQTLTASVLKNRNYSGVNEKLRTELVTFFKSQSEVSKRQASEALKTIPREMLFIIKILDLLRSNERKLITSNRSIFKPLVPESLLIIYGYCLAKAEGDKSSSVYLRLMKSISKQSFSNK